MSTFSKFFDANGRLCQSTLTPYDDVYLMLLWIKKSSKSDGCNQFYELETTQKNFWCAVYFVSWQFYLLTYPIEFLKRLQILPHFASGYKIFFSSFFYISMVATKSSSIIQIAYQWGFFPTQNFVLPFCLQLIFYRRKK